MEVNDKLSGKGGILQQMWDRQVNTGDNSMFTGEYEIDAMEGGSYEAGLQGSWR